MLTEKLKKNNDIDNNHQKKISSNVILKYKHFILFFYVHYFKTFIS